MKNRQNLSVLLCAMLAINLMACGGGGSDAPAPPVPPTPIPAPTPTPTPVPTPTPTPPVSPLTTGLPPLHTQGTLWLKDDNSPITLRGTNIGNWLLQEFWMMNQSSNSEATDQCRLEAKFDERFGFAERERLMDVFRDNWIGERDWDILQSFGFNVIRLPFIWNLIEDENKPMTLRDDAWQYIDYAIDKAQEHGMYVILDLHGAVGAQGFQDHSGCADKNQYWSTPEYQLRTIWLWQEIAKRYQNNGTVAAYGLLNEPWGTDAANLANIMLELFDAVRKVDEDKIIVLPGHNSGIDAYGSPASFGGTNVAFEMHFYPGIFGWGEPNYQTHRDWLTCSKNGLQGVCEWDARMQVLDTPLLIGEFQPWANLGIKFGAKNAQATFDKYAQLNWAATSWSYKVLNANGGQNQGTWGMVTNKPNPLGLIAKSSTWTCAGWDSSLENACEVPSKTITPDTQGEQTYYFLVKAGACCGGALDTTLDKLSLVDDDGVEHILNGDFGSSSEWTQWRVNNSPTFDFNFSDSSAVPAASSGPVMRLTGVTNSTVVEINGGIYQAIRLVGGKNYTLTGVFKDNGSNNAWVEFYLVKEQPIDDIDVISEPVLPSVDFANAPIAEIESIFKLYGTVDYEVHEPLKAALTSNIPSTLYTLPATPQGLTLLLKSTGIQLSWNANSESDVTGYNIYRRSSDIAQFELIGENIDSVVFDDTNVNDGIKYFYKVAAVDAEDISYASEEVASGNVLTSLPGLLQAENWTAMYGFELETTTDAGGGSNIAFADPDDWLEYAVETTQAGSYRLDYRLASLVGSAGFTVSLNGNIIDTVNVSPTGGWQIWTTQTNTINLPEGKHVLRVDAKGAEWNLNWIRFSLVP